MTRHSTYARLIGFLLLGGLLAVGGLTGCGAAGDGGAPPVPSSEPHRVPAAVAGGACQFLDYDVIEKALGARFDVAAAGTTSASFTCVLQGRSGSLPDLSLAVTATKADPTAFKSAVMPKKATSVSGLGKIGYSATVAAGSGSGPGIEVGWLSGNQRLMVLRYRAAPDTPADEVDALSPKLVDLAKKIDLATV